jgi:hypothetical protein
VVGLPFFNWDTWHAVALNLVALAAAVVGVVLLVRARRRWFIHDRAAWWGAVITLVGLNGIVLGGVPLPVGIVTAAWLWVEERKWERQLEQWAAEGI